MRDLRHQVAVADAIDIDGDLRRVDRGQRRAELAQSWQDIGAAGEMRLRRTVLHIDLVVGVLLQVLADCRGQAFTDDDGVALAVFEALDADLALFVGDRRVGRAGDGDIGDEVGLARERIGEIETDARIGGFVVHLIIEDAEAVLQAQILVYRARVGVVLAFEAGVVGVERDAPGFVARFEIAERRQRFRLRGGRLCVLIGGIGGQRGASDDLVAPVGFGVVGGLP